jgi:hypothetical protein
MLLICMAVAFGGGLAWERRPPIGFDVPWPASWLLKTKRLALPDGLAVQLEREKGASLIIKTRLQVCEGSYQSLGEAVEQQNLGIQAMERDSRQREERLRRGLERTKATLASAERRAAAMDFTPQGATICARYEDVDRHVVESRR